MLKKLVERKGLLLLFVCLLVVVILGKFLLLLLLFLSRVSSGQRKGELITHGGKALLRRRGHVCAGHVRARLSPRVCVKIDYTAGENVINSSTNKDPSLLDPLEPVLRVCVCVYDANSKNQRRPVREMIEKKRWKGRLVLTCGSCPSIEPPPFPSVFHLDVSI